MSRKTFHKITNIQKHIKIPLKKRTCYFTRIVLKFQHLTNSTLRKKNPKKSQTHKSYQKKALNWTILYYVYYSKEQSKAKTLQS